MNRLTVMVLALFIMLGYSVNTVAESPYLIPKPGSTVKIKRTLVVPPGYTKVYLQRGQVVSKRNLDRYYPSCNFEVWKLRQTPTKIHPGTFSVARTVRDIDFMVQLNPLQRDAPRRVDSDYGGMDMIIHVVHMRLKSTKQPNVYRLTCRSWQDFPPEAKEPTMKDMREALGGKASIRLSRR